MYNLFQTNPPRRIGPISFLMLLNSGIISMVGWAFVGVGMIFFWIFFMQSEILNVFEPNEWQQTEGEITYVTETSASENEQSIYRITFSYEVKGETLFGTAYGMSNLPYEKQKVGVFFAPNAPEVARIQGFRRHIFGPFAGLVGIFPLLGLLFVLGGYWQNLHFIRLLIFGHFTHGKLIDPSQNPPSGGKPVMYGLYFEFVDKRGQTHRIRGRSDQPSKLLDEEEEPLLYLEHNPQKAVMFDGLPYEPVLKGDNRLAFPAKGLFTLILPAMILLGNGLYVWVAYGS